MKPEDRSGGGTRLKAGGRRRGLIQDIFASGRINRGLRRNRRGSLYFRGECLDLKTLENPSRTLLEVLLLPPSAAHSDSADTTDRVEAQNSFKQRYTSLTNARTNVGVERIFQSGFVAVFGSLQVAQSNEEGLKRNSQRVPRIRFVQLVLKIRIHSAGFFFSTADRSSRTASTTEVSAHDSPSFVDRSSAATVRESCGSAPLSLSLSGTSRSFTVRIYNGHRSSREHSIGCDGDRNNKHHSRVSHTAYRQTESLDGWLGFVSP